MDAALKKPIYMHVVNVTIRTNGGLQQQVGIFLDILDVGFEDFGQMGVPSLCHLQYEHKIINHKTWTKIDLVILRNSIRAVLCYLRVQGTSDRHLPLFGKHFSHEKVTTAGEWALQTILLTGKVYLEISLITRSIYIWSLSITFPDTWKLYITLQLWHTFSNTFTSSKTTQKQSVGFHFAS